MNNSTIFAHSKTDILCLIWMYVKLEQNDISSNTTYHNQSQLDLTKLLAFKIREEMFSHSPIYKMPLFLSLSITNHNSTILTTFSRCEPDERCKRHRSDHDCDSCYAQRLNFVIVQSEYVSILLQMPCWPENRRIIRTYQRYCMQNKINKKKLCLTSQASETKKKTTNEKQCQSGSAHCTPLEMC